MRSILYLRVDYHFAVRSAADALCTLCIVLLYMLCLQLSSCIPILSDGQIHRVMLLVILCRLA